MGSVQVKYAIGVRLSAVSAVVVMFATTPATSDIRGVEQAWAAGAFPRSTAE